MGPTRPIGYEYRVLLSAVLLLLIVYPILRGPFGSPILARMLLTVVYLAGGYVVLAADRLRFLAAVLGGLAILGAWTGYTLPAERGVAVVALFHTTAAAFQAYVILVVLRRVYRERTVSIDSLAAALCGYLLLGVLFGHVYCLVEAAVPGAFRGVEVRADEPVMHVRLTYLSFITLTTVGFGDITPANDTSRSLVMIEAVAGQFYLAVLIADLVGKRIAQMFSADSTPSGGELGRRQPPSRPPT